MNHQSWHQKTVAQTIDHTLLKPNATANDIAKLCEEALEYNFATVCIPPYYLDQCFKVLENSSVGLSTVIGFPLGYQHIAAKVEECKRAIESGVDELDVVVNIAAVKSGDWDAVESELDRISTTIRMRGKIMKLIFENCFLTDTEIIKLCKLCNLYYIDYAKTSTGFGTHGALVEHLALMRSNLGDHVKIKASGGIKDYNTLSVMIKAGADRIGTSSGVAIIKEMEASNL